MLRATPSALVLAIACSGCLTYQAAVKPDEPKTSVMLGFLAAEVGTAALFGFAIQDGDESKMQEDLDYPVAAGLSLLGVLASDLLIMLIYEAAASPTR